MTATTPHPYLTVGLLLIMIAVIGCGAPQIDKPAYELADVLYRVCDKRSTEQLEKFTELLASRVAAGTVSTSEAETLTEIVSIAQKQQWSQAKQEIRELLKAQIE
jgi:hypothetical protein